jgi:hypothetical protein
LSPSPLEEIEEIEETLAPLCFYVGLMLAEVERGSRVQIEAGSKVGNGQCPVEEEKVTFSTKWTNSGKFNFYILFVLQHLSHIHSWSTVFG